jgi:DNA replication protein DnaC
MAVVETLVGREPELRAVHELVDGVRHGGGALVLSGEPGIGKPALIAEAGHHASDHGVRVPSTNGRRCISDANVTVAQTQER